MGKALSSFETKFFNDLRKDGDILYYIYPDIKMESDKMMAREAKLSEAIKIYDPTGKKEDIPEEAQYLYDQLDAISNQRKALDLSLCIPIPVSVIEKAKSGAYEGKTIKEVVRDIYDSISLNNIENQILSKIK